MIMISLNTYLTFDGDCEQAFDFYRSVFGGAFQAISRFEEMPENLECDISEKDKNKIMHISLPISEGHVLMGSDSLDSVVCGTNYTVSINTKSKNEATRLFEGLSGGGVIKMPLEKTFWNSYFGKFTDQFGIQWMVNCDLNNDL